MTLTKNRINWMKMFKETPPKVGATYTIHTEQSKLCASRLNQMGWSARREHRGNGWTTVHVVEAVDLVEMRDSLLAKLRKLGTPKLRAIVAACEQNGYFDEK